MTENQKFAIIKLLEGATITGLEITGVVMKNKDKEYVITERIFKKLLPILRHKKQCGWVIDLRKVRRMHGLNFIKRQYNHVRRK